MSKRFARHSHEETLGRIQNRLDQHACPLNLTLQWRLIGRLLACPSSHQPTKLPMSEKKPLAHTMRGDADRLAITSVRND
jgi:hypothetical protein